MLQLFYILLCVILSGWDCAWANSPKVLVVHSYAQGYPWTKSQMEGIQTSFDKFYPDTELFIEYLDWKNYPYQKNFQLQYDEINYKYKDKGIELVIVTDNVALDLMINLRPQLFPRAPIVFSGINNYLETRAKDEPNIGGITETLDYESTIRMMLDLHPETKDIALILDSTEISRDLLSEFKQVLPKFQNQVKFKILHDMAMPDILREIKNLPEHALLLCSNFSIDKDGRIYTQRQALRMFTAPGHPPAYGLWEVQLGHGIIGGSLLDARLHGQVAAELGIKALSGEKIPVIQNSLTNLAFDYNQLKRFNIPLDRLPKKAFIKNLPESIFRKYKTEIIFILLVIGILIIMNVYLIANIRKRHIAELERDRLLVEEKKARHSAEEAVKAREMFISLAAHEFRTPLTVLTLQLQLLLRIIKGETKRPSGQEEIAEALQRAGTQTKRLDSLIEDLIYVAHTSSGEVKLNLQQTDLTPIINKLHFFFQPTLTIARSELNVHIEGNTVGNWDKEKIEKLIENLLSNAIKFGNHKPIDLFIKSDNDGVLIKVKDQGIGIYKEDRAHIFEKFGRAVSELNFGGFGLGLYIAQLIAEAHRGYIKVESEPGVGSVFIVFLPYQP